MSPFLYRGVSDCIPYQGNAHVPPRPRTRFTRPRLMPILGRAYRSVGTRKRPPS
jgi:hypothetical protein